VDLSPQKAERYCPHCDYMEINEMIMKVDADTEEKD
jgi:hypothetical protein